MGRQLLRLQDGNVIPIDTIISIGAVRKVAYYEEKEGYKFYITTTEITDEDNMYHVVVMAKEEEVKKIRMNLINLIRDDSPINIILDESEVKENKDWKFCKIL